MTRNRKAVFEYRRNHPKDFKEICETCIPPRHFKLLSHKEQHDKDKHSSPSLRTIKAGELNSFICDEIEPDTTYNQRCKAVVHRLCCFMQNELKPSEVIKSGSLGKGTAVKGKSDADLVVFLNNIDTISELQENMTSILDDMKSRLNDCDDYHVEGSTQFAVKISINCDGHSHSVDILPSINIIGKETSEAIDGAIYEKIYKEMRNASQYDRKYYSAALAPLQEKFVSRVPPKVKTLIRLIKYWRKTEFQERTDKHKLPSSYPLELIVIKEWEMVGNMKTLISAKNFIIC